MLNCASESEHSMLHMLHIVTCYTSRCMSHSDGSFLPIMFVLKELMWSSTRLRFLLLGQNLFFRQFLAALVETKANARFIVDFVRLKI